MVQINELAYSYQPKKTLFDSINLSLPSGNIYGLLGKNGAGKSTLLKLISGLLFPVAGTIEVVGYKPSDRYPDFLNEVFLIAEEFYVPEFSIDRFVSLYSPFYPRFNHQIFEEYAREFQLPKDQKLSSFSYGQKKKFLLSFGLASDCKLLILDEPTNGLDIPSKSQFRKLVANAIHEDRTFIVSTHQVRDIENLIDPVIVLEEGEVVFNYSMEEVSSKLEMVKLNQLPSDGRVVYSETSLGGYTVVRENLEGNETNVNLELLFNAVVSNKEMIHEIFKAN